MKTESPHRSLPPQRIGDIPTILYHYEPRARPDEDPTYASKFVHALDHPYGVMRGFVTVTMAFLLTKAGIPMELDMEASMALLGVIAFMGVLASIARMKPAPEVSVPEVPPGS